MSLREKAPIEKGLAPDLGSFPGLSISRNSGKPELRSAISIKLTSKVIFRFSNVEDLAIDMNMRKTSDVLTDLLAAQKEIVTNYPEGIQPTATSLRELIKGTAAFGVGPGLKCGEGDGQPWPEWFPENPVQFFGHNWGNQRMLKMAQEASGEAGAVFWRRLMDILAAAEFDPTCGHTTNVLQGIKSGPAAGSMSNDPIFLSQCLEYMRVQIRIVQPRLVVTLGETSARLCRQADRQKRLGVEIIEIMHPSTRARNWGGSYEAWIGLQAKKLRQAIK